MVQRNLFLIDFFLTKMGENLFWIQLKAILTRNGLLKLKRRDQTITEILMPLIFIFFLILIRLGIPQTSLPELRAQQTAFNVSDLTALSGKKIGVVASRDAAEIIATINSSLQTVGSSVLNFDSEHEFMEYYNKSDTVMYFCIVFDNFTADSNVSYVLRAAPELGLPDLDHMYSSVGSCHPKWSNDTGTFFINEMASDCPARRYYDTGFVQLQSIVDAAIINKKTGKSPVSELSVVVFPKESYEDDARFLRYIVPFYMAIALTPVIAYLCILIVGEKERKIKIAMKLMGLRESVYWLGWFVTYGVFIMLLALIITVLLVGAKITPNANILLLWILIVLYGLSIITIAFLVTPFFNSSKAAGGFASISSVLVSFLYQITLDFVNVHPATWYAISLLSPTAFALGMDKVVELDLLHHGVSFSNFWGAEDSNSGYYFGSAIIMLAVDIVLYGLLAFYFDNVIPSEYGRKRPPWFFMTRSFWCPLPSTSSVLKHRESIVRESSKNTNFEKVPTNLVGKEALRILKMSKVFSRCRKEQVLAVDDVSLDIYEGQITAILGHNGAGKTTLLNMIVGLTEPTSGTAIMCGLDIVDPNNYGLIWQMIGICPQQDVLFDELSPKHHLEFFGRIKGVPESDLKSKIDNMLTELDLIDRKDVPASKLSGGQKRKLSVCIALIGDPKIVILDEPTSGVDPYSRRRLWNLLQKSKEDKLIILTTHFMDEADILADRKAIISWGKVKCVGSSLFLKNKFGLGYHLTMVMEENFQEKPVTDLIRSFIPNAMMIRATSSELAYTLPFDQVAHFSDLLRVLDDATSKTGPHASLRLKSYGMSMTTLEEIFLKLAEDDDVDARKGIESSVGGNTHTRSNDQLIGNVQTVMAGPLEYSWWQAFVVMVKINILLVLRQPRLIITTIVVPIILIIFTFDVMRAAPVKEQVQATIPFNLGMYPPSKEVLFTNSTDNDISLLLDLFTLLEIPHSMFNEDYGALLDYKPHTFLLNLSHFDPAQKQLTLKAAYNDTEQHSLPIFVNMLSNVLMGLAAASTSAASPPPFILISAKPLPRHSVPVQVTSSLMGAVVIIGLAYIMMTSMHAASSVDDRELGFIPYIAVFICDIAIVDKGHTAWIMHCIFTIFLPVYSPFGIMYYLGKVYTEAHWKDATPKNMDYFSDEIITSLVVLPIQGVLFFILLWILDYRSGKGQWSEIFNVCYSPRKDLLHYDTVCENEDIPADEDEDVSEERRLVQNLAGVSPERAPVVVVQGLRKEFATGKCSLWKDNDSKVKVAVQNLTLAVHKGEVFGLLGHNGAGKTTTVRTIVADEFPTKGKVTVAGFDMATNLKKAIRKIGYCPQQDALWKNITLTEHLECYANIKGIKRSVIPKVVGAMLEGLRISEHAKKKSKALSGGTKRKLSYAISMLGDPKIVLLDEPSTGMDPQSKRYFWNTIMAGFQEDRGAVLTTHSMEEADILCNRVGIMVKGQLKCIGSTQHLKNKYGSGYVLEAKIIASGDEREHRFQALDNIIRRIFKNATIQEKFEDRVKYHLPQTEEMSLAEIFYSLEEAKRDIGIEEYSFSQTTLEQVFLEFAKQQEFESDNAKQILEKDTYV